MILRIGEATGERETNSWTIYFKRLNCHFCVSKRLPLTIHDPFKQRWRKQLGEHGRRKGLEFAVRRSPFTVHRSPFIGAVRGSGFGVRGSGRKAPLSSQPA